ncbi:tRNA (guanosine(18)-2'-O)-methyltransferase TrmH [Aliiglaciecola sp. CAU 1673]|uniref:tRNA (guanosine(18)-2'-O)-methyltransferase TrmH n=1 Tax=Aliiglaciecola sp. CAU 1673 TaxID=3032595 RepID=UPI0023DA0016|nr:tRNA (guanosine(18)-2'-O)-methyltransferase TrmH [Aliiglaciecola sp. CAU 1673]MDF2177970.1 tRNA (guanosine(18)-2'-O)-methyltransferase TrmH [Aliiglaciecola sp. CAU 1673]
MTPERYQRIRKMLNLRQPDLTVCMEQVHKTHNLSAIVRSADAVGIHRVHLIWAEDAKGVFEHHPRLSAQDQETALAPRIRRGTSMGSQNWLRLRPHLNTQEAVQDLKSQGMQVLVAHLSDKAVDFRDIDYTQPTAVLFGQEKYGATEEAVALADQEIMIPMMGMVQSLNVSVAAALVLYEAQRQRQEAGLYDPNRQHQRLDEQECQRMLFECGYPELQAMCLRKGLGYPYIDEQGQIQADDQWWQVMRQEDTVTS